MLTITEHIDIMSDAQDAFIIVGDLMTRGHYWPSGVTAIRETAPRPPSPTEKFLPGQRIAFLFDGKPVEHEVSEAVEWDQAEASITETVLRSPKKETIHWRLSELYAGTIRVTITFSADYGALEKIAQGKKARAFYHETLQRLKKYVEDKQSFAGPRTYVPKPAPSDPLAP